MNILKRFKSKYNPIDYEQDTFWYENNYVMLGSEWVYDSLKKQIAT